MSRPFAVEQIDHVEVQVPDLDEAARWYERTLGLVPVPDLPWDEPRMISSDGGSTKLALFTGTPQQEEHGWLRVGFRVSGAQFLAFLARLDEVPVQTETGEMVSPADIVDHGVTISIYFTDPYGNRLELTTPDHEEVRAGTGQAATST